MSLAAFFVPLGLLSGADLSGWAYPPPAPAPLIVNPGDSVELLLAGHLDDGTPFMINTTVNDTIGSGGLVSGLEADLVGLASGEPFDLTVPPDEAYGPWNASRLVSIPRTEVHNRIYSMAAATFRASYGAPVVGHQVGTQPWPSTVTAAGTSAVALRYDPTVGVSVLLYLHWGSTVLAFNNTTITTGNDLFVGYSFELVSKSSGKVTEVHISDENATAFTLDLNPALAGQTLHYEGTVIAITPGPGAVRTHAGAAVGLGPDTCERCHADAGFASVEASASASRQGKDIVLNLTVANPWLHEDLDLALSAAAVNGSALGTAATAAIPSLPASATQNETLTLPGAGAASTVSVVVNVTAHHIHASGGKPSDLPYQLTLRAPVGAATRSTLPAQPAPAPASIDLWVLAGRITGFAALAVAALSAVQGYRRHLRRAPHFKWPPWLTVHFSLSMVATVLTVIHAIALMSTTYRGVWTWDIDVGVISLAVLGAMGVSGIVMAKWTTLRAPRLRKWHFWMMVGMLVTGFLHTAVSGTTLRMLLGV